MEKKLNSRGIALVSVMMLSIMLVMFVACIAVMTMNQQLRASSYYRNEVALKAADAGIAYAMSRLETFPGWRGCIDSTSVKSMTAQGLKINEIPISGGFGCVEGKMEMGSEAGIFDLYFTAPPAGTSLEFTNLSGSEAPDPNMLISANNTIAAGAGNALVAIRNFNGETENGRFVPINGILIVSRGRSGTTVKTVEACIMLNQGCSGSSVVVARGNLNINHHGKDSNDKIILASGSENKPSFFRSVGMMNIGLDASSMQYYPTSDYLVANNGSGGTSEGGTPRFNPEPAADIASFKQDQDIAKYIPKLKIDKILPQQAANEPKIPAGSYVLVPGDALTSDGKPKPRVYYYATDDIKEVPNTSLSEDARVTDFDGLFEKGDLSWDPVVRRLTIHKTTYVTRNNENPGLTNLNFISERPSSFSGRLTVHLAGASGNSGDLTDTVSLVNPLGSSQSGGSINIKGQVSGFGSIISRGDLDIEAESTLEANPESGICLYSGGTVTIHEMDQDPLVRGITVENPAISGSYTVTSGAQSVNMSNSSTQGSTGDTQTSSITVDGVDVSDFLGAFTIIRNEYLLNQNQSLFTIPASRFSASQRSALESLGFNFTGPDNNTILGVNTTSTQSVDGAVSGHHVRYYSYVYDNEVHLSFPWKMQQYGFEPFDPNGAGSTNTTSPDGTVTQSNVYTGGSISQTSGGFVQEYTPTVRDSTGRLIALRDSTFRGFVYSCKDFKVNSPNHAFTLVGGLAAFGGDSDGNITGRGGNISINARHSYFRYNTKYLGVLAYAEPDLRLMYWTSR